MTKSKTISLKKKLEKEFPDEFSSVAVHLINKSWGITVKELLVGKVKFILTETYLILAFCTINKVSVLVEITGNTPSYLLF